MGAMIRIPGAQARISARAPGLRPPRGSAYELYRSLLDFGTAPPLDTYLLLIRTSAALGRYAETAVFIDDYRRCGE